MKFRKGSFGLEPNFMRFLCRLEDNFGRVAMHGSTRIQKGLERPLPDNHEPESVRPHAPKPYKPKTSKPKSENTFKKHTQQA